MWGWMAELLISIDVLTDRSLNVVAKIRQGLLNGHHQGESEPVWFAPINNLEEKSRRKLERSSQVGTE